MMFSRLLKYRVIRKFNSTIPVTTSKKLNSPQLIIQQQSYLLNNKYKGAVLQFWSLLEACLQIKDFNRAIQILKSLYVIEEHRKSFIDDYNYYLNTKANSIDNIAALENMLHTDLSKNFPGVDYNARTLAILTHHAIRLSPRVNVNNHINKYWEMNRMNTNSIVKMLDILTIKDLKILWGLKLIKIDDLPESVKHLINVDISDAANDTNDDAANIIENSNDTNTDSHNKTNKVSLKDEIKTLYKKNIPELEDVDTIGMKVVKHTLSGLKIVEEDLVNFPQQLKDLRTTNFFSMQKSVNDFEQFKQLLDDININRQKTLELTATDMAKERWKYDFEKSKERGDLNIKKSLNSVLWQWYQDMLPIVKEEIATARMKVAKEKGNELSPYLVLVNSEKMCVIAILELLKLNSTGGVVEGMRTARAVLSVGKAVEMEFRSEQILKNEQHLVKDLNKKSKEFLKYVRNAQYTLRSMDLEKNKIVWPQNIVAQMGSFLISVLIRVARVEVEGRDPITKQLVYGDSPAFSHSYEYRNGSKLGCIKIHKNLINQLNGESSVAFIQPQLLPMLLKPRPWTAWKSGGYHYSQSLMVRTKDSPEQLAYLEAASNSNSLEKVFDGLNVLGETAWTVNSRLFNIVSKVWNSGEEFLDIPKIQDDIELVPKPPKNTEPADLNKWKIKNRLLVNDFAKDRSIRCDLNYKLEIARGFIGERIFFPHNIDFRGRAYPLSPHFNNLGNDMTRSLLLFWEGKRLGKDGLRWLKIHLSNLYGVDKVSLDDRFNFIESHLDDVRESAENPLTGQGWWKKADKPWQALAACMELNDAYKLSNPEDYISHQPVYQDGSCNGLQHYAALGGDIEGAEQVNLIPGDKPRDVYTHVAELVRSKLSENLKTHDDAMAKFFVKNINRKMVKQTVMTNVYGVTFTGATFQIDKQIKDFFDDTKVSIKHSQYLATHVLNAIKESFKGAHLIQDWLGECCKIISKSISLEIGTQLVKNSSRPELMTSVIWTSPLGLPVVQPYREDRRRQVNTNLQTVYISDPFAITQINARRQKAAFPPNFIHSLDASHMLLTAKECSNNGLVFASVHDSFWTHACDVDTMNKILREQFVKLHEGDIIKNLKKEFDERYKNFIEIVKIPKTSEIGVKILELRKELGREKGHNLTFADEISMEKERLQLLKSSDPEDVKRGQSMITTISLANENIDEINEFQNVKVSNGHHISVLAKLKLPDIPPKDRLDIHKVLESQYFFS